MKTGTTSEPPTKRQATIAETEMLQATGHKKVRQAAVDAHIVDFYVCNMVALQVIFKNLSYLFQGTVWKDSEGLKVVWLDRKKWVEEPLIVLRNISYFLDFYFK